MKPSTMAEMLSDEGRVTTGEDPSPEFTSSFVARLESLKNQLENADDTAELDALAAPWFDSAVGAYGKAGALALELGVTESYLSAMRAGKKPVALRHVLPLLKSPDAVRALCRPMCEMAGLEPPQPQRQITRTEVLEQAVSIFASSPQLLRMLVRDCQETYGARPEDVLALIGRK